MASLFDTRPFEEALLIPEGPESPPHKSRGKHGASAQATSSSSMPCLGARSCPISARRSGVHACHARKA